MNENENTLLNSENNKKKGPAKIIILLAVIALLAIVLFNYKVLANSVRKLVMTPEDYCHYVLSKKGEEMASCVASIYDRDIYSGLFVDNTSSDAEFNFKMNDDGIELIDDLFGNYLEDIEFESLKDLSVAYQVNHKGKLMNSRFTFKSNNKKLLDVDLIVDTDKELAYIGIPSSGKNYMLIDLEDSYDDDELDTFNKALALIEDLGEVSITPEKLEKLISRYMDTMIKVIDDVEEGKDTLTIEGVSEKFTTLEFEITPDMLAEMLLAAVDELADDDEVRDYAIAYMDVFDVDDSDDIYDMLIDGIDDLADLIEDAELSSRNGIEITLYVDKKGKIKAGLADLSVATYFGRMDVEVFSGYTVKGSKFGFEAYVDVDNRELVSASGEGKFFAGKFTGNFEVDISIFDLEFEIKDLSFSLLENGIVTGTVTLSLDQFKSLGIPRELRDYSVYFSSTKSGKVQGLEIGLCDEKDKPIISFGYKVEIKKTANLKAPSSGKLIEVNDGADVEDYIDDLDFDNLIDFCENLDVDDVDDVIDRISREIGDCDEMDEVVPFVLYYLPIIEIGSIDSAMLVPLTGIMAPQLIKYIEKSKVSSDMQLADSIRSAIYTAMLDPDIVTDSCYDEVCELLSSGCYINEWGLPDNAFEIAVADVLGINNFSELETQIKSTYSGEGIYVRYSGYSIYVELQNTDYTGRRKNDGTTNISVGY